MHCGPVMQPDRHDGERAARLHALADDLCVLAYDIETAGLDNDIPLARRARALCHELRTVTTLETPHGALADTVDIYVGELVRRARALLAYSDSQVPSPASSRKGARTASGTRPRVLGDLTFDDDPPTSPGAPRAIQAQQGREMIAH